MVQATSYVLVPKSSFYESAQMCLKRGYFCWKLLVVFKTVLRYAKLWAEVDILNFFVQPMLFLWAMRIVPVFVISCLIAIQTQCNVFLLISYAELALVHYKKTHFGLFCTWKSWFLIFFWFSPWAQSSLKVCQKKRHLQILWRYPLFLMCNSSIHSKATLHTRICHLGHFLVLWLFFWQILYFFHTFSFFRIKRISIDEHESVGGWFSFFELSSEYRRELRKF